MTVSQLSDAAEAAPRHQRLNVLREGMFEIVDAATVPRNAEHWSEQFSQLLSLVGLDSEEQQSLIQTVTWRSRIRDLPDPTDDLQGSQLDSIEIWRIYCSAYFKRFEFKFRSLSQLMHYATRRYPGETMFKVFEVFGALNTKDPSAAQGLENLYPSVNQSAAALDTLLHGVWLSNGILTNQDEWIMRLSSSSIRIHDRSANIYFWRSSALRRMGDYPAALESVEEALERHSLRDNQVHQDYVRERELIRTVADISEMISAQSANATQELESLQHRKITEVRSEFEARAHSIEDTVARSLTGVVEILGIFLALLGFLVGSGYLALNADSFWRSLAAFGVLAIGSLAFLLALRLIVRPQRRHKP